MAELSKENIENILKTVEEPNLKKDIVSLNTIKNIAVDGAKVIISLEISTPVHHIKNKLKNEISEKIRNEFKNVKNIEVEISTKISTHVDPKKDGILPGVKNTIAVASGKGGVGKSTVAVNLAVALAKDGAKVGLIDADIYGPSIPLMLGVNEKPKVVPDSSGQKLIPIESYGVKLMSIGFLIDEDNPVIWRGPMASGAVKQFMSDVQWGEIDYLIFDLPPGTGDIQLTLVQTIPLTGSIIVTTPQNVSLIDAKKGLQMFERVNVPVFGIIENMSYFIAPDTGSKYDIFGSGGGEKLSKELNTNFLGGIPIEQSIREGGDDGLPIVIKSPEGETANKFMDISRNLAIEISKFNSGADTKKIEIILNDNN